MAFWEESGTHGCSSWRYIVNIKEFLKNVKIKVNNGAKADFWNDHWHSSQALAIKFPRLFEACTKKSGSVSEYVETGPNPCWNILMSRRLTDHEISEAANFSHEVMIPRLNNQEDEFHWLFEGESKKFSVKKQLAIFQAQRSDPNFQYFQISWKYVCEKNNPSKIQFACLDDGYRKVPVQKRIKRTGMRLDSKCLLCCQSEEDDIRFFFHCPFSIKFWALLRGAFQTQQWNVTTVHLAITSWKAQRLSAKGKIIWEALLHPGIWILLNCRN